MKRFWNNAGILVIAILLLMGCAAASLTSIKPTDDPGKVLGILMRLVEKCEPDGEWRCLSIPDKDIASNNIEFVIYKHIKLNTWGFGITNREASIIFGYAASQDIYFVARMGAQAIITKERFEEAFVEFITVLCEKGDLSGAKRFVPVLPTGEKR